MPGFIQLVSISGIDDLLYHFSDLVLDSSRRELRRGEHRVPLEPQVFEAAAPEPFARSLMNQSEFRHVTHDGWLDRGHARQRYGP